MKHRDCLIVGAGVVGLSLARELARRGLNVLLIDRQAPGREASWAGAGILPPGNAATAIDPLDKLRAHSYRLHGEWAAQLQAETGIDNGYRVCGGLYLARSAGEAAALFALQGLLSEQQIPFERLAPADLANIEPGLKGEAARLRAAYLMPGEAQLRNPRHLRALVVSCRKLGVEIVENAEALEFDCEHGQVSRLLTTAGPFLAAAYCLTAGAWTRSLLSRLGVPNGIYPVRGQMVLFRCERPPITRILNDGPRYLVPREDGHLLAGSTEEEAGFEKNNTPEAVAELTGFARELVPALREAPIERTWAGLRPASLDGLPYLGPIPGLSNAYAAAGHFRSGLYLSTGTAEVMSDLIRGETPAIELAAFRLGRG